MRNFNTERVYANTKIEELGSLTSDDQVAIERARVAHETAWIEKNERAKRSAPGNKNIGIFFSVLFLYLYATSRWNWFFLALCLISIGYTFYYRNIALNGIPHEEFRSNLLKEKLKKQQSYKQGLVGEQYIENLLTSKFSDEYVLINDLILNNCQGNIDHVVIGPSGIIVIETKYWSNTYGSIRAIYYSDYRLHVYSHSGYKIENYGNPVKQVKTNAKNLYRELENIGIKKTVVPIVVIIGLDIPIRSKTADNVIVLNPRDLVSQIQSVRRGQVSPEEEKMIVDYFQTNYHIKESNSKSKTA